MHICFTILEHTICFRQPHFWVSKNIGTAYPLHAINELILWPTVITKPLACFIEMFFQAFTEASYSCGLFLGGSPFSLLFSK